MYEDELALFGGTPVVPKHEDLKIEWPIVESDDRDAVLRAFDQREFSGRSSPEVYGLEREVGDYVGMPYATGLNSATAALHAALFSLGIEPGDEVIVPNLTFVATAMAVIHCGAVPVFADICPRTFNVTASTIADCLSPKTKAVIVVHMHGIPADIDEICAFCRRANLKVIEDVAQAPGARLNKRQVGSFGDASVFSFMSQKNIGTCGECGILLSRTAEEKSRAEMLRIYGEIHRPGTARSYNSYTIGWNYTLNPIQAAMARTQLRKYPRILSQLRPAGRQMNEALGEFSWLVPPLDDIAHENVFHFYRITVVPPVDLNVDAGRFRKAVQDALAAEGLNVRHYQNVPLRLQPTFRQGRYASSQSEDLTSRVTKEVLRATFVLGAIGSSPAYLLKPGTIEAYARGFRKIDRNIELLRDYALTTPYRDPWDSVPVTSDSFGANYEIYTGD